LGRELHPKIPLPADSGKRAQAIDVQAFFGRQRVDLRLHNRFFPAGREMPTAPAPSRKGERKTRSSAQADCRLAKVPAIGKDRILASGDAVPVRGLALSADRGPGCRIAGRL